MTRPHLLIIDSLRDLYARCTCGGWRMEMVTIPEDSDGFIRERAKEDHELHTNEATQRWRKAAEQWAGAGESVSMKFGYIGPIDFQI